MRKTINIIISGRVNLGSRELEILSDHGENKIYLFPNEEAEIDLEPQMIDAIICNWFFKYHELSKYINLKYIQLTSSGYNGINVEEVKRRGIILHNAKGVYSIPISESVVLNILGFYRKSFFFYENQKKRTWEKNRRLEELYGKNVLIVGTGDIGTEIAKRIGAFTPNIYGCNRSNKNIIYFKEIMPLNELRNIVGQMDIIILTLALNDETEHIIDKSIFSKMKKSVLIINVSRGQIIKEEDLIDALNHRNIGGAILDVFEEEPLQKDNLLWGCDNTIITPHNAFVSDKNDDRLNAQIIRNYTQWRKHYER